MITASRRPTSPPYPRGFSSTPPERTSPYAWSSAHVWNPETPCVGGRLARKSPSGNGQGNDGTIQSALHRCGRPADEGSGRVCKLAGGVRERPGISTDPEG